MAGPWISPGHERLRHDLQWLADESLIAAPLLSWPLPWADALHPAAAPEHRPAALAHSLARVRDAGALARREGWRVEAVHVAAGEPARLPGFAAAPRGRAEAGLDVGWLGENLALRLNASAVASDPLDDAAARLDGSYLALRIGNVGLSAGLLERWWGPGWDGSLIAGTHARPFPALRAERLTAAPFESSWLSWLGPWRLMAEVGRFEFSGLPVSGVRYFGARFEARPTPWLQFALSRSAQWCGTGRPCDADAFLRMLAGIDNRSDALPAAREPGNQLAGYDLRIRSPWPALPVALYGQAIGEDEAGLLPAKFLLLGGLEYWGEVARLGYRLRIEHADTACNHVLGRGGRGETLYLGCAYENSLYPQGYRYRGRTLGHALERDGRMTALGLLLVGSEGRALSLRWAQATVNRGGGAHPLAPSRANWQQALLRAEVPIGVGRLHAQLAIQSPEAGGGSSQTAGFIGWSSAPR